MKLGFRAEGEVRVRHGQTEANSMQGAAPVGLFFVLEGGGGLRLEIKVQALCFRFGVSGFGRETFAHFHAWKLASWTSKCSARTERA